MFAAEKETDNSLSDDKIVSPDDAIGHEELRTVDDQSGKVAEEEHDDNTDKDTGKIHLIVSRTVTVGSHVSIPVHDKLLMKRSVGVHCLLYPFKYPCVEVY